MPPPDRFRPKGLFYFSLDDFDRDTLGLDDTQKMLYLRLLVALWEAGGYLPHDEKTVAKIWKARRWGKQLKVNWKLISGYLTVIPDPKDDNLQLMTQKRILKDLLEAAETHDKQAKRGRAGGLAKAANAAKRKQDQILAPARYTSTQSSIERPVLTLLKEDEGFSKYENVQGVRAAPPAPIEQNRRANGKFASFEERQTFACQQVAQSIGGQEGWSLVMAASDFSHKDHARAVKRMRRETKDRRLTWYPPGRTA